MSFPYTTGIPNPPDNPSSDVSNMQTNTNTINSWVAVDHIGFNNAAGGLHKQVSFAINQASLPTLASSCRGFICKWRKPNLSKQRCRWARDFPTDEFHRHPLKPICHKRDGLLLGDTLGICNQLGICERNRGRSGCDICYFSCFWRLYKCDDLCFAYAT